MSDDEHAAIGASEKGGKAEQQKYQPLYRDPMPGEKVYMAPQRTMFGMASSLTRVYAADDSASAVFREWHEATGPTRDSVLKRLERKKAIFYTLFNTEARVQKVFPDQMVGGIYPVQVELLTGPLKGTVAWANVANVSPVPGIRPKEDPVEAEKHKAELQATIDRRKNRRQKQQARANSAMVTVGTTGNAAPHSQIKINSGLRYSSRCSSSKRLCPRFSLRISPCSISKCHGTFGNSSSPSLIATAAVSSMAPTVR